MRHQPILVNLTLLIWCVASLSRALPLPLGWEIEEVPSIPAETITQVTSHAPPSPTVEQSTGRWLTSSHPSELPSSPPRTFPSLATDPRAFRIEALLSPRQRFGSPPRPSRVFVPVPGEVGRRFAPGAPRRALQRDGGGDGGSGKVRKRGAWARLMKMLKGLVGQHRRHQS